MTPGRAYDCEDDIAQAITSLNGVYLALDRIRDKLSGTGEQYAKEALNALGDVRGPLIGLDGLLRYPELFAAPPE